MIASATATGAAEVSDSDRHGLCRELTEAFDSEFERSSFNWRGDESESFTSISVGEKQIDASSLELRATRERVRVFGIANSGGSLVAVCSEGSGTDAAVGLSGSSEYQLLAGLADAIATRHEEKQQSGKLSHLLSAYAEQVSVDFEELAWLRSLSTHMEHCDASRQTSVVAARVIESLPDLLRCETVVVFHDPSEAGSEDRPEIVATSSRGDFTAPLDRDCRWVVETLGRSGQCFPVVANTIGLDHSVAADAGIRSLILLPVRRESYRYGWLLAFNRLGPEQTGNLSERSTPLGAREFGTVEAGLVQSASVLLATHAWNQRLFSEKEELLVGTVKSLARALEARDAYTSGHSDRVAAIGRIIARQLKMGESDCERLHLTGLLHDVGKVGVPDHVLNKPGRLTADEYSQIKEHVTIGYGILKHIPSLSYTLPGVLHHHESFDGSGYPHGLAREDIPYEARILAVADAYDAMTSCRPYRRGMPHERAQSILKEESGRQFDPDIVAAFMAQTSAIRQVCDADHEPLHDDPLVAVSASGPESDQ